MPKHLFLLFIATFILGGVTGVIFLLQTKTGGESSPDVREQAKGFFVSARMYGGCARGGTCSSYSIEPSGAYTYLESNLGDSDELFEEKLTRKQRDALKATVEKTALKELKASTFTGECPVTYDGVAYTFHIVNDGDAYDFDSCRENILETDLFQTLVMYFEVFSDVKRTQ